MRLFDEKPKMHIDCSAGGFRVGARLAEGLLQWSDSGGRPVPSRE